MMKKIVMLCIISNFVTAYGVETEEKLKTAVCAVARSYFPRKKRLDDDNLLLLSKDLKSLSLLNKKAYSLCNNEKFCQHIVESIACQHFALCEGTVAQNLAHHIPIYKKIYSSIQAAFVPDSIIEDAWYANVRSSCQVKHLYSHYTLERISLEEWRKKTRRYYKGEPDGWNGGDYTPLSLAIKTANIGWVALLLLQGADINKKYPCSNDYMFPLYEAIKLKNEYYNRDHKFVYEKLITLLLMRGANVEGVHTYPGYTKHDYDTTPLQLALRNEDEYTIRLLLRYGADISKCKDTTGLLAQMVEEVAAEKDQH